VVFGLGVLTGLGAGWAYGLPALEQYVARLPEYQRGLRVELVEIPAWLQANPHVVERILEAAGVSSRDRRLDGSLARRVAGKVSANGWVERVNQVSIGADDVVRVSCDYREPVAWVVHGSFYYLVDKACVRLPGRYVRGEVTREGGLLLVAGVVEPPPPEGQTWSGVDVRVGVQMVGLLRDRPFYNQIVEVLVENHGGRRDRRRPHIELTTDAGARIRWGRAPGEEIDEPTAEQKLAHLQGLWREYRRVDMGRPWVDIQVWPDRVIVPACSWQDNVRQRS